LLLGTRGVVLQAEGVGRPVDAAVMLDLAERAEAAGLDSVWVGDSLVSKPRLEPVAAMAAIAARTSRVKIGTAVMLPALRSPVPLAHSLATVDILSNGRAMVGAGVGGAFTPGQRQDWTAAGVDSARRAGRLTEMVQVMKRLWTEDHVTFHGKHFHLDDVTLYPRPVQPGGVPVLLATHYRTGSEAQARRAAQYADGTIGISDSPEELAQTLTKVDELTRAAGRDPEQLQRVFYMTVNINDDAEVAAADADDFLMAYYGVRHWTGRWGPWGSASAVAARMAAYVQAGTDHLIVRFASWDQPGQWERFEGEALPAFRRLVSAASA
ncbi:MAG: LLM class flavin-dependent oxidoreductase, partial [Dehalococcoidia bacterium]